MTFSKNNYPTNLSNTNLDDIAKQHDKLLEQFAENKMKHDELFGASPTNNREAIAKLEVEIYGQMERLIKLKEALQMNSNASSPSFMERAQPKFGANYLK